jgi:hypothetical protein
MYSYNPDSQEPVVYCFAWSGLNGVTLAQDLILNTPYQGTPTPTAAQTYYTASNTASGGKPTVKCCALIESIQWSGEAAHSLGVTMWVTKDNQVKLWGATTVALTNTTITKFTWWAGKYDTNTKTWFDWCYQLSPALTMNGQLGMLGGKPVIKVSDVGQTWADGSPDLYKVTFSMASAGNYPGYFQEQASPTAKVPKAWGSVQTGTATSSLAAPTDS